jgi:hypothetical protein
VYRGNSVSHPSKKFHSREVILLFYNYSIFSGRWLIVWAWLKRDLKFENKNSD